MLISPRLRGIEFTHQHKTLLKICPLRFACKPDVKSSRLRWNTLRNHWEYPSLVAKGKSTEIPSVIPVRMRSEIVLHWPNVGRYWNHIISVLSPIFFPAIPVLKYKLKLNPIVINFFKACVIEEFFFYLLNVFICFKTIKISYLKSKKANFEFEFIKDNGKRIIGILMLFLSTWI